MDSLIALSGLLGFLGVLISSVGALVISRYQKKRKGSVAELEETARPSKRIKVILEEDGRLPQVVSEKKLTGNIRRDIEEIAHSLSPT